MSFQKQLSEVTAKQPCIHCGKGDWCYRFANSASVCNRGQIASGWEESGKTDKNGAAILYPVEWEKKKPKPKAVTTQEWLYPSRQGEDLVKVIRQNLDDGGKKIFQNFWNGKRWLSNRPSSVVRSEIPIYRYKEIQQAIRDQKDIFIVEGEKVADKLIGMGFAATTNIQGAKNYSDSDLGDLAGASRVILCPDKDAPGLALMKQWEKGLRGVGVETEWLYAFPKTRWDNLPDSGGLDLFDWIVQMEVTGDELLDAIGVIPDGLKPKVKTSTPLQPPTPWEGREITEKEDNQAAAKGDPDFPWHCQAVTELFADRQIATIDDQIYEYLETHYQRIEPAILISEFRDWAARTPVFDPKTQREKYSLCNPRFLNTCLEWLKITTATSADALNPPGINLANGVLICKFSGRSVSWELKKHSPRYFFTYCSPVAYNPDADPTYANKLLEALEPTHRQVFLRTIAAAIDLGAVRKVLGRGVRAAICRGSGANGKDSLKEAIALIFGDQNIASCTFGDFKSYDGGRKFDLAKLRGVRFNWPSENNQQNSLDLSESMNAAITGDRGLVFERKGKDGIDFVCNAVHLFNCNQLPKIKSGLDSLTSRFCVLDFFKTFKANPDPSRGELLADPRFKYDPEFMAQSVCPALLNEILAELPPLLVEGINYQAIAESLDDVQEESTHLWEFCKDTGIIPNPEGRIYIHDIWYQLQTWYESNGTLERVDKPDGGYKNVWHEQANKWDVNITGANQIFKRFKQLFPKIDKKVETQDPNFKGRALIVGLTWDFGSPGSLPDSKGDFGSPSASLCLTNDDSASPPQKSLVSQNSEPEKASSEAKTLDLSTGEAGEAKNQKLSEPEKLTQEQLTEFLGYIDELKRQLAWEPSKFRAFCQFQTGKSKPSELTLNEAYALWNALIIEAEKV